MSGWMDEWKKNNGGINEWVDQWLNEEINGWMN